MYIVWVRLDIFRSNSGLIVDDTIGSTYFTRIGSDYIKKRFKSNLSLQKSTCKRWWLVSLTYYIVNNSYTILSLQENFSLTTNFSDKKLLITIVTNLDTN